MRGHFAHTFTEKLKLRDNRSASQFICDHGTTLVSLAFVPLQVWTL
jgi:hypothetical protein